jgi:hypothetical protein
VRAIKHIDQMYAFVQTDPKDQTEGVIGFHTGQGWMPMVGADMDRVEYLRPMAQKIADATDTEIRLIRFTLREEIEVIKP